MYDMPRKCPLNKLTNEKLNGPLSPFINPELEEIMMDLEERSRKRKTLLGEKQEGGLRGWNREGNVWFYGFKEGSVKWLPEGNRQLNISPF